MDSNWEPHGWGSMVLSTEPRQLLDARGFFVLGAEEYVFNKKLFLSRDATGTIPNFLNFTVAALTPWYCTKIPDWTQKYGIIAILVFNKGILIHFPVFQTFSPFLINYLYLQTLFHFSWSSFFLSQISWFQEISWKVASLLRHRSIKKILIPFCSSKCLYEHVSLVRMF